MLFFKTKSLNFVQTINRATMRHVTTDTKHTATLAEAAVNCYAGDGALYMPERVPALPKAYFNNIEQMTLPEIAYVVMSSLLGTDANPRMLKDIVDTTFNFPLPLVDSPAGGNISFLELFHGPTLAFKDFGTRFMAEFLNKVIAPGRKMSILTATTGNTGAAIAHAFRNISNADIYILYPRGVPDRFQHAMFSAPGNNSIPVEVSGDIGKCKEMVRRAVEELNGGDRLFISANSVNILRILPQVVFYFQTYARLRSLDRATADGFTVAVPCGNLSNLTSAIIARQMGLPMGRIIAACDSNDDFVRMCRGTLSPADFNTSARPTLARAMDTGFPSNLNRVLWLCGNDISRISDYVTAESVSDREIAATIIDEQQRGYTVDPHTAVALAAARRLAPEGKCVVMATAHPAKSLDRMTAITGRSVELPLQLTRFMSKPRPAVRLAPSFAALGKLLANQ